nr:hypothetical protein CFP56_12016 [Quercus suber]
MCAEPQSALEKLMYIRDPQSQKVRVAPPHLHERSVRDVAWKLDVEARDARNPKSFAILHGCSRMQRRESNNVSYDWTWPPLLYQA